MEIYYTSRYKRDFRKLPKLIQLRIVEREDWFMVDPFDARLKTHQLHGSLSALHAFSISSSYRIIFEFKESRKVALFLRVGQHDIYDI